MTRHSSLFGRHLELLLAVVVVAGLSACQAPPPPGSTDAAPTAATTATAPRQVKLALPFQPDVQFAPLYLAQDRGYYREAGLDVEFTYGDESEQVRLAATGAVPAAIAGGDQVILARAGGIPVTYVMTWFQRFPLAVFGLGQGLSKPADLIDKKVGLPAASGTSYLGWQALLLAAGIAPDAVKTEIIGYTQRDAVANGTVDAAVGYVNNEPLQLAAAGKPVSVINVADTINLVSNGLVVGQTTIDSDPALVQALVTGTLRGIAATLDDPDAAFEAALKRVPEAGDPAVRDVQRQVLEASLALWDAPRLGAMDRRAWEESQRTMRQLGLIDTEAPIEQLIDGRFIDAAGVTSQR